jgi:transposase-like protein
MQSRRLDRSKDDEEPNMKETTKAIAAFAVYRDAGPARRIEAVAQELGVSSALLYRWSREHHWSERVLEHDRLESERAAEVATVERLKLLRQTRRLQLRAAMALMRAGLHAVARADSRDRISAATAVDMLTAAADMMRRAVGDDARRFEASVEVTERTYIGVNIATDI